MTTTILIHTSAASAIRHSCQHGWRRVEIDTSTLTPEQRELLASRVVEDQGARYATGTTGDHRPYDVAPPTAEGLVAHLDAALEGTARVSAASERRQLEQGREDAEEDRVLGGAIDSLRASPGRLSDDLYGRRLDGVTWDAISRRYPDRPAGGGVSVGRALGLEAEEAEEAEAQRRTNQEAAAVAVAEVEATAARHRAEDVAWLREQDRPELAERAEAGVLPQDELLDLARELLLPAGRLEIDPYEQNDAPESYTAEQWAAIKSLRAAAADLDDVSVTPATVDYYRPACEGEDGDDDDEVRVSLACVVVTRDWNGHALTGYYSID